MSSRSSCRPDWPGSGCRWCPERCRSALRRRQPWPPRIPSRIEIVASSVPSAIASLTFTVCEVQTRRHDEQYRRRPMHAGNGAAAKQLGRRETVRGRPISATRAAAFASSSPARSCRRAAAAEARCTRVPVKPTPYGCGLGSKPGGSGSGAGAAAVVPDEAAGAPPAAAAGDAGAAGAGGVGGVVVPGTAGPAAPPRPPRPPPPPKGTLGIKPNGTRTVGYPGFEAMPALLGPGKSSASRLFALIAASMPLVPPSRMSRARSSSVLGAILLEIDRIRGVELRLAVLDRAHPLVRCVPFAQLGQRLDRGSGSERRSQLLKSRFMP